MKILSAVVQNRAMISTMIFPSCVQLQANSIVSVKYFILDLKPKTKLILPETVSEAAESRVIENC